MTIDELITEAEKIIAATRRRLPASVRPLADALPVVFHDWASEDLLGEDFEPDILGLFVGDPHGEDGDTIAPHIVIFVESLFDFAESDLAVFREEVRLTYLHELGHYLGWDEDQIAARGLE